MGYCWATCVAAGLLLLGSVLNKHNSCGDACAAACAASLLLSAA